MNINDYTGKPYNFRNYNCWTHVRAVRADAGLDTPAFDVAAPSGADAMFAEGFRDSRGLVRVYEPQDFDAVCRVALEAVIEGCLTGVRT